MSKGKICFISLGNLYLCPYLEKYTSILDCEYDIIYWNRHDINESSSEFNTIPFEYQLEENRSKLYKLVSYIKFRSFIRKIIKENKYDAIILLQTSGAILLNRLLLKKYAGKYIIDIRDYTLEKNKIFYTLLSKLIKKSAYTVISSEGFEEFLPKHDYVIVHNDVKISQRDLKKMSVEKKSKKRIIISYIGLIRFQEQNKKNILKFKNDERYFLKFIGKGASDLEAFIINNNVNNVELIDYFHPNMTLDHYINTDIIYNLYGNNNPYLDYALSNKLYYGASLRIPILVCPGTFMETISLSNNFGLVFDINDPNALTHLHENYLSINPEKFEEGCKKFMQRVQNENHEFEKTIKNFQKRIKEEKK